MTTLIFEVELLEINPQPENNQPSQNKIEIKPVKQGNNKDITTIKPADNQQTPVPQDTPGDENNEKGGRISN